MKFLKLSMVLFLLNGCSHRDQSSDSTPPEGMIETIDAAVVRSCSCHRPTQEQIVEAVRKTVSVDRVSNEELVEYMDDFAEVHRTIYDMIALVCRLEIAKRARKEGINLDVICDCINNNQYQNVKPIPEGFMEDPSSLRGLIWDNGCGSTWKDNAKYNFIRSKFFEDKMPTDPFSKLTSNRYARYLKIVEKVNSFCGDSVLMNIEYQIARNFKKHKVDKKIICKIFGFSDDDYESFVN